MSSLALYRTYRPGRFDDVVGQEHVTVPLMRALSNDRVHHAYLFSGPRGCGKTSSARILARSLNCANGPTAQPCGECQSCTDLAPNGSGSIDVIELDAATHGLVDDARDLREKAHFAPVSSRFKIYIIDEAHQLGPGAANALLKLIEEPPAHLKFIFATTAPDKILGTIRSRTHHYPFRLIPARTLQQNLAWICEQEGVVIDPAALALVARAGAGSARDAQSVLGQLIAGAGDDGVTYELAVALLGFTDAALLDGVVDAVSAGDGGAVFAAVDRVMDSGHDPRRFLTDLLERFRDLVVVRAVPDAVASGLIEAPADQAERMATQASGFGPSDLVRLADVVDEGITAMKGATPTRLQLELVCARLLLPGADDSVAGVQARLDRLERRVAGGVVAATAEETSTPPAAGFPRPEPGVRTEDTSSPPPAVGAARPEPAAPADAPQPTAQAESPTAPEPPRRPASSPTDAQPTAQPAVQPTAQPAAQPTAQPSAPPDPAAGAAEPASEGIAKVRQMWPDVLVRLRDIRRTPWSLISQESAVTDLSDGVLTLAFRQPNLRDTFARREDFQDNLRQAIKDILFMDVKVEAIVDPSADPSSTNLPAPGQRSGPGAGKGGGAPADTAPATGWNAQPSTASEAGHQATAQAPVDAAPPDGPDPTPTPPVGRAAAAMAAARRASAGAGSEAPHGSDSPRAADDRDADPNDADLDDSGLSERDLLARALGATVIEEIDHDA